jgi:hypothetical protein
MNTEIRRLGKTYITVTRPWGLNRRSGHRLLCADGKIRAAELAAEPDTFFSTPAKIRIKGKWITGYMSVEDRLGDYSAFMFNVHDCYQKDLPERFPNDRLFWFIKKHAY